MSSIAFFPTVTSDLLDSAGLQLGEYSFSYKIEDNYLPLVRKGKSTLKLTDPHDLWDVVDDGLRISRQVSIEYPDLLMGPDGIAPRGASVGVCIVWRNKSLTQMGYIKSHSVIHNGVAYYNFRYEFVPGEISGDLSLETVLYIEKPAETVEPDEGKLMNRAGVTLGEIDFVSIAFSSDSMEFPIVEVSEKSAPLWWLELAQWDDPTADPFCSDYVCLYLNTAYSSCPKAGSSTKGQDLLVEIISTAYCLIFQELINRDCIDRTLNDIGLEPGSIAKVMYYFAAGCDPALRTENPAAMQKSIRINIERMLREENDEL